MEVKGESSCNNGHILRSFPVLHLRQVRYRWNIRPAVAFTLPPVTRMTPSRSESSRTRQYSRRNDRVDDLQRPMLQ